MPFTKGITEKTIKVGTKISAGAEGILRYPLFWDNDFYAKHFNHIGYRLQQPLGPTRLEQPCVPHKAAGTGH